MGFSVLLQRTRYFLNPLLAFTPITPDPTPLVPLPFSSSNSQQPQQQVPLMPIPVVLMPLLSNGADHRQQWESSSALLIQQQHQPPERSEYDYKVLGLVTTQFFGASCYLIKSSLINQNAGLIFVRHVLCEWWQW